MKDTHFNVPDDSMPGVVTLYRRTPGGLDHRPVPEWRRRRALVDGRGNLHFAQMLVNKGELNGTRLLGSRTVDLMASNHVGELLREGRSHGGSSRQGLRIDHRRRARRRRGPRRLPVDRQLRLERRLRHHLLGRSEGGPDRNSDGADAGRSLRADFQNAVMQVIVD